jgi:hypothetical protein
VGEDRTRGHSRTEGADTFGESGWITTEVAARAVRVSPRTIRRYIDQGKLEAKPQGEGVRREWLVSVDSLHALRASRTIEQDVPESDRSGEFADSLADVLREMSARLESKPSPRSRRNDEGPRRSWQRSAAGERKPSGSATICGVS